MRRQVSWACCPAAASQQQHARAMPVTITAFSSIARLGGGLLKDPSRYFFAWFQLNPTVEEPRLCGWHHWGTGACYLHRCEMLPSSAAPA